MADVFVSYKAEDRRRIRPLVEALQAEGHSVWWDEQIGGGIAWRQTIEAELNAAKCVIVVWSKHSVGAEGTFVQDEATRAQERRVYVPVTIDRVHLPLGFGETQALPLMGWRGSRSDKRYEAILAAVRRNVRGISPPQRTSPPRVGLDRRGMLAGGAVAAIGAAGVGGWALLRARSAGPSSDSIAVLPFENLSGDPAKAYFSDGIAEEIRSALARITGLKVVGRTSSEAVRNDDAETAAKKLEVANILTGSVRQSPSTIRITAELVDGRSGLDRWSQDYDRSPGDAIKIQTDIAENVASTLSTALGRIARTAVPLGGTTNAAAQDLYLRAKAQSYTDDSEDSFRSILGLLNSAIALDPNFAEAHAQKAEALTQLVGFYTSKDARYEPGYAQAAAVARRAISLAPNLAAGHIALADILMSQLNIGAAGSEYEKAYSLPDRNVANILAYSGFVALLGESRKAIILARQAQERDPLNPAVFSSEAQAQLVAHDFPAAARAYRKTLQIAPNLSLPRALLAWSLIQSGKTDEAMVEFQKVPPDFLFRLVGESMLFAKKGDMAASDAAIERAERIYGDTANYQYAEAYAQRGDKDRAMAALNQAWAFRDPGLALMHEDPLMDPIRTDPRFAALLRKLNYPSA